MGKVKVVLFDELRGFVILFKFSKRGFLCFEIHTREYARKIPRYPFLVICPSITSSVRTRNRRRRGGQRGKKRKPISRHTQEAFLHFFLFF